MNQNFSELIKEGTINEIVNKISILLKSKILTWNFVIKELVEQKRAYILYNLATNIENAPIEKLADAIIKVNDAYYIYVFARDVKNAPIEILVEALINLESFEYIKQLILNNFNKLRFEEKIENDNINLVNLNLIIYVLEQHNLKQNNRVYQYKAQMLSPLLKKIYNFKISLSDDIEESTLKRIKEQ